MKKRLAIARRSPRATVARWSVAAGVLVAGAGVVGASAAAAAPRAATSHASRPSVVARAAAGKHIKLAFMSFAVTNSYDAPMLAAAKKAAAADNASLTVFDANNNPNTQFTQLAGRDHAGRLQRHHHPADREHEPDPAGQAGDLEEDQGRQHRPDPRGQADHVRQAGAGDVRERHVRPDRDGRQPRAARRRCLQDQAPESVQRRLPLRHQGVRTRRRDQRGVQQGDQGRSRRSTSSPRGRISSPPRAASKRRRTCSSRRRT